MISAYLPRLLLESEAVAGCVALKIGSLLICHSDVILPVREREVEVVEADLI